MTIAELVRGRAPTLTPTPYAPFVVSVNIAYTYASFWTTTFGAPDDSEQARVNVKQVTQDYLNKYALMSSLNDCLAQSSSFYYDHAAQTLYVHMDHDYAPYTCALEYGYAFGLCSGEDLAYISDYEYLPLLESIPSIEQSADILNSNAPTLVSGTMIAHNVALADAATGKPAGPLDFLISENVYGNDVFLYDYDVDTETLTALACLYVEDYDPGLKRFTFYLQDKRKKLEIDIPTSTFTIAEYPNLEDSYIDKIIPIMYGQVAAVEITPVNGNDDPDSPTINAIYRLPDGTTDIGTVYVQCGTDEWIEAVVVSVDYETELLTVSNGRGEYGSTRKAKLTNCQGITYSGHSYPRDVIVDLLTRYLGIAYTASNYNLTEWEAEFANSLVVGDIGFVIDKKEKLLALIHDISRKSKAIFRFEYSAAGLITARVKDLSRVASAALKSVDIRNATELEAQTDASKVFSSILVRFSHNYAEDTDLSVRNVSYFKNVASNYRVLAELDDGDGTFLINEADASARAYLSATEYSTVPRIVTLELPENFSLKIFDTITATLQPDDLDSSGRVFLGECSCLVLSINPDPISRVNTVSVLIIDSVTPETSIEDIGSPSYNPISRSYSTIELLRAEALAASAAAEAAAISAAALDATAKAEAVQDYTDDIATALHYQIDHAITVHTDAAPYTDPSLEWGDDQTRRSHHMDVWHKVGDTTAPYGSAVYGTFWRYVWVEATLTGSWAQITGGPELIGLQNAATAQTTADSKNTKWPSLAAAKTSAIVGDSFIDNSLGPNLEYITTTTGEAITLANSTRITPRTYSDVANAAARAALTGMIYGDSVFQTDTAQPYVYTSSWIVNGPALTAAGVGAVTSATAPKYLGIGRLAALGTAAFAGYAVAVDGTITATSTITPNVGDWMLHYYVTAVTTLGFYKWSGSAWAQETALAYIGDAIADLLALAVGGVTIGEYTSIITLIAKRVVTLQLLVQGATGAKVTIDPSVAEILSAYSGTDALLRIFRATSGDFGDGDIVIGKLTGSSDTTNPGIWFDKSAALLKLLNLLVKNSKYRSSEGKLGINQTITAADSPDEGFIVGTRDIDETPVQHDERICIKLNNSDSGPCIEYWHRDASAWTLYGRLAWADGSDMMHLDPIIAEDFINGTYTADYIFGKIYPYVSKGLPAILNGYIAKSSKYVTIAYAELFDSTHIRLHGGCQDGTLDYVSVADGDTSTSHATCIGLSKLY